MTDSIAAASLERLARAYLKHGKPKEAASLLESASNWDPKSHSIWQLRVLAAFQSDEFAKTLALASAGPPLDQPEVLRAMALLEAICLQRLGRTSEAQSRFEAADRLAAAGTASLVHIQE